MYTKYLCILFLFLFFSLCAEAQVSFPQGATKSNHISHNDHSAKNAETVAKIKDKYEIDRIWSSCPNDILFDQRKEASPEFLHRHQRIEQDIYLRADHRHYNEHLLTQMPAMSEIPVVFHVVQHPSTPTSSDRYISDQEVVAGLEMLNRMLQGLSACPEQDQTEINTDIQLCLAERTIFNTASNGIVRYTSELANMDMCTEEEALKQIIYTSSAQNPYPSTDYLNVWLVEQICVSCSPGDCLVAGFSSFPADHGTNLDGLVVESTAWYNNREPCEFIKVGMHELGHYFGLYHTFQGGCFNNDCHRHGDKVCDTPPDNNFNIYRDHPCLQGGSYNSCNTDGRDNDPDNPYSGLDVDDLNDNFMDYAPVACLSSFTQGQIDRMHHAILEARFSLLESEGCQEPCNNPITYSDLTIPDTIWVGENTNFSIMTSNDVEWSIWPYDITLNGSNTNFIPDEAGLVRIELTLDNGNSDCLVRIRKEIVALCPLDVEISSDPEEGLIDVGTAITYQILSPNHQLGYYYIWQVNGIAHDTLFSPQNLTLTIGAEEYIDVKLIVSNGFCSASSDYLYHRSTDCREQQPGNVWPLGRNIFEDSLSGFDFRQRIPMRWDSTVLSCNSCSAGYDENGNLLFYSDGYQVIDKSGNLMMDMNSGSSFSMPNKSQLSSGQHFIIPVPTSSTLFYLVTPGSSVSWSEYQDDNLSRIRYALIDKNENGGLGGVISSGVIDHIRNTNIKMDVIRQCDGLNWWLIVQNNAPKYLDSRIQPPPEIEDNYFYLYTIDEGGFNFQKEFPWRIRGGHGEIFISPGGRYMSHFDHSPAGRRSPYYDPNILELIRINWEDTTLTLIDSMVMQDRAFLSSGSTFSPNSGIYYDYDFLHPADQYKIDPSLGFTNPTNIEFAVDDYLNLPGPVFLPGPGRGITGFNILYERRPHFSIKRPDNLFPECDLEEYNVGAYNYYNFLQYSHILTLIDNYTYGHPHGIYGADTVMCGDTSLFLTTDACPGREYIWSSKNGAEVVHEGETGELKIYFPYAGEEEFYLEKVTQCRSYFDTLQVTVLGDCKEECEAVNFSINEFDTVVCQGEPAWLEWSADADSVALIDLSTLSRQSIENRMISLPNVNSNTCYELIFHNGFSCDTSFQFCIEVRPELEILDNVDKTICDGEDLYLDISTDADRLDLINQVSDYILPDIQPGTMINTPESDSCYTLRLQREDGCDTYYDFCVDVYPVYADTSSYQYCDGDEAFFQGMRISSDTFVCAHLTSSFSCDSVVCADFIFSDEEVVSEEVSLCTGDTLALLGQAITEAGSYQQRYERTGDCDSLQIFEVVEEAPPLRNLEIELCQGETIELYGENLSEEGQYLFEAAHSGACDSLIGVQLMLSDTFYQSIEYELCDGDSIWVVDNWENSPGWYTHRLSTSKGCDSVIETRLRSVEDISGPELSVLCEELLIEARQAVPENWSIEWSNGDTLRQTTYEQGGTNEQVLLIRQQDSTRSSCIREIAFSLPVLPQEEDLQAFLQDTQANQGELIQLSIPLDPEIWKIAWSSSDDVQFDCDTCFSVELRMSNTSQISYVLTHQATGCEYAYHFQLELVDQKDLFLPSAFSPNDDGNNDQWEAFLQPYVSNILECRIYNRWGGQVAAWQNVNSIQWDGTQNGQQLNPGVYVYFLRYQLANGEEKVVQGDVTLAR